MPLLGEQRHLLDRQHLARHGVANEAGDGLPNQPGGAKRGGKLGGGHAVLHQRQHLGQHTSGPVRTLFRKMVVFG